MKIKRLDIVNTVLLAVVIILQVVTMVAVFGGFKGAGATEESDEVSQDAMNADVVNIDTPYGAIQYPSEWMDYLKFAEKEDGDIYHAIFSCSINGRVEELFTVTFGATDQGTPEGYITKDSVQIPVTLERTTLDKSSWTKEEYEIVSKMQDAADDVIDSILAQKLLP